MKRDDSEISFSSSKTYLGFSLLEISTCIFHCATTHALNLNHYIPLQNCLSLELSSYLISYPNMKPKNHQLRPLTWPPHLISPSDHTFSLHRAFQMYPLLSHCHCPRSWSWYFFLGLFFYRLLIDFIGFMEGFCSLSSTEN